jgi:hypothetical protein
MVSCTSLRCSVGSCFTSTWALAHADTALQLSNAIIVAKAPVWTLECVTETRLTFSVDHTHLGTWLVRPSMVQYVPSLTLTHFSFTWSAAIVMMGRFMIRIEKQKYGELDADDDGEEMEMNSTLPSKADFKISSRSMDRRATLDRKEFPSDTKSFMSSGPPW